MSSFKVLWKCHSVILFKICVRFLGLSGQNWSFSMLIFQHPSIISTQIDFQNFKTFVFSYSDLILTYMADQSYWTMKGPHNFELRKFSFQTFLLTLFRPDLVTWRSSKGWFCPWLVGIGSKDWTMDPFEGMKAFFPHRHLLYPDADLSAARVDHV